MSTGAPLPEIREPRPRRLLLVGVCLLLAAGFLVVTGILSRARSEREVIARTQDAATPYVAVIAPKRGADARELILPGDIQAFSNAPIYPRASGYVSAWRKDIGDRVKKGDVLAEIDTPDLDQQYAQAKADVATALANFTLAKATADRYQQLVGQGIVSKQANEEKIGDRNAKQATLDASRANLARLEALVTFKAVVAPFDGVVTARAVDVGTLVNAGGTAGAALYQVADIRQVRVYVRVPQALTGELKVGLKAQLRLPQYPQRLFDATLVGTSNSIAQESRTALVQLQAANPDGILWPGNYAEVHFKLGADPNALRLPATALMFGEKGIRIATLGDDDKVVVKPVQIGRDIGSDVEILSGLVGTDRVIDSPVETLNNGDPVRIAQPASDGKPETAKVADTKSPQDRPR
jgi:RND family efflux transporter MFP subunit